MLVSGVFPAAAVYLVLLLLEALGVSPPAQVDYLQDGVPTMRIAVVVEEDSPRSLVYRMELDATDPESQPMIVRIEESDLVTHTFLAYPPGANLPIVMSIAPMLAAVLDAAGVEDLALGLSISVPEGETLVAGADEVVVGSDIHLLVRGDVVVLSAPAAGVVLVAQGDVQ